MDAFKSTSDINLTPCNCVGPQVVDGVRQPACPCVMRQTASVVTPAKGLPMPRTVGYYQTNAIRDQELILEQKAEIERLKYKLNNHSQRMEQYRKRLLVLDGEITERDDKIAELTSYLHIPKGG